MDRSLNITKETDILTIKHNHCNYKYVYIHIQVNLQVSLVCRLILPSRFIPQCTSLDFNLTKIQALQPISASMGWWPHQAPFLSLPRKQQQRSCQLILKIKQTNAGFFERGFSPPEPVPKLHSHGGSVVNPGSSSQGLIKPSHACLPSAHLRNLHLQCTSSNPLLLKLTSLSTSWCYIILRNYKLTVCGNDCTLVYCLCICFI